MTKKARTSILSFACLRDGYVATIENAIQFFGATQELMTSYPDKALSLAQLGQEEIGKSLTILAAFALPPDQDAWKWFWTNWSNHQLKSHRAYLYEIISPTRLVIDGPDGTLYDGRTLRSKISQEKESGFYVDFDADKGCFVSPIGQVAKLEVVNRMMALIYLSVTADGVRRALLNDDEQFRLTSFGELAYRICTEPIYQQDMPSLVESFRKRSARHEMLISDLEIALAGNAAFLRSLPQPPGCDSQSVPKG